jgi:hypothetical protein
MKEMDGLETPAPQAESVKLSRRRPFNRREELLTAEWRTLRKPLPQSTQRAQRRSFFTEKTFNCREALFLSRRNLELCASAISAVNSLSSVVLR